MNTALSIIGNPVTIAIILGLLSLVFGKSALNYKKIVKAIFNVIKTVKDARDPSSPNGKAFSPQERKEIVDGILIVLQESSYLLPKAWRIP